MRAGPIYRSEDGREEIEALYERGVRRLSVDVDERRVPTRYGDTHVLEAGPPDAPTVVAFHGGNTVNPLTLAWFRGLADDYRLVAPDLIGHPGLSAQTRLDPASDEYAEWVVDALDALGIGSAPMIGASFGAGVVLSTAAYAPGRVSKAGLIVPAGLARGSILPLALRIGLPALLYRHWSRPGLLDRVLEATCTVPRSEVDPLTAETFAAVFRHVDLERRFPGVGGADELAGFSAPTYVAAGADDPFFPAERVVPTARSYLPDGTRLETLPGERHLLSPAAVDHVEVELRRLLSR